MIRAGPPFRAETVGSLLRPAELKEAHSRFEAGVLDAAAYEAVLDRSIRHAVALQEEAGLQAITDGEFGRSSWFGFFFARLRGFRLEPAAFRFRDDEGNTYDWPTCVAESAIRRERPVTLDEFRRLKALTSRVPKMTMPSPSAFHFFRFHAPADPAVYPEMERYWDDLVEVFRGEIADLAAASCTYIQLDEVPLAMLCDPSIREQVRALGGDPQALVSTYIDVLRRVLAEKPAGVTFGLHLCRGNFRNRWMAAGGYDPIAERLFNEVPVDAYLLEYDTVRAGDFSPLRFMPKGKVAALGLISSKRSKLEAKNAIKRRLAEATRYAPIERLALCPQCGFASVAGGNLLSEAEEAAKLRLVTEVAREVWG